MSYLDDLKKKGQQFVQNVQNAANTAKNVYNAAQQGVQNVYNAATGNTQKPATPQAQAPNTKPSPAAQTAQNQQNQQAMHEQAMTDWAAEYDKVMSGGQTPTNVGSGTARATQPPVSNAAQNALGEGAGQWQAELDNVMAQIMGKGKFDYNMNGDAMYQQYADIYQNQANLGMQNAMAQAAALTGGYGSSYGQMVGQQAYAQQMQGLNDIGLELYDRAYAQDMAERSQLMDQYNMLAAREEKAYNRAYQEGRDKVADDQWDKTHNWQLEQFDKLYGDEGFYATESQKDRDQQTILQNDSQEHDKDMQSTDHTNSLEILDKQHTNTKELQDDSQAHDITLQTNDQTHDKNMATQEHDWQVEEWDKMYGDLVYDDEGNIIGGGYQTKKDHQDQENWETENEQEKDEFDKLYGYTDENGVFHEGYYDRTREDEQEYQQGIHNDLYGYTDEKGEYHEGYYEKEANKDREQDQKQFDSLYGYTDENGNKVSGYYEDMADKEFNQMYGPEGYMTKKDKQDQANWQAEFDREGEWYDDAQEAANPNTTYKGEGALNGQSVPKQLAGVQNLTTTNTNLFDETGSLKSVAIVKTTPTGDGTDSSKDVVTYNIGGKEVELRRGYSPYTNNKNPDANNGTFNGYQPNNVASYYDGDKEAGKLSNAGFGTIINGQTVPVYTDGKGVEWVYDAANNKYEKYEYEEKKEPTTLGTGKGTGRPSGVYAPTQVLK